MVIKADSYLDSDVDSGLDNECCLRVLRHIVHHLRLIHLTALPEEALELLVALHNEGVEALKV